MFYIYLIINLINRKLYVGQTNYPERRWSQHKYAAKNYEVAENTQVITRAIHKYGIENFEFKVIEIHETQEAVNKAEQDAIKRLETTNPKIGYNIEPGGHDIRSPETLRKISVSLQKYYETHDGSLKGKHHSEEAKQRMSEVAMGKPGTNTGKTFDEDWKFKISSSNVGRENKERRRFPEEVEKEICRLYVEGSSTYKLGKGYDCTRALIITILDRNSIERRPNNRAANNGRRIFTNEQELEICNVYVNGKLSMREISKKFGCGNTTVRDILIRNKISLKRNKI